MTDALLSQYGIYGIVIGALSTVCVFLYRELKAERKEKDEIQGIRLQEIKESRDRLTVPMEQITEISQKMYELLLSGKRGR